MNNELTERMDLAAADIIRSTSSMIVNAGISVDPVPHGLSAAEEIASALEIQAKAVNAAMAR